jgi:hypothetical protein
MPKHVFLLFYLDVSLMCSEIFFLEHAGELRINILRREGCKETQSYITGFCFGRNLYKKPLYYQN